MAPHFGVAIGLFVGNAIFTPVAKTIPERITVGFLSALLYIGIIVVFKGLRGEL